MQYYRQNIYHISVTICEYSAWSIFEYSTTVSRTVNVSSWPPATTTAPGPTLTLNGQYVKKSLVEQWVHDQKSTHLDIPSKGPWSAGRARTTPIPQSLVRQQPRCWNRVLIFLSFHLFQLLMNIISLYMPSASKVLLIVVVFGDHMLSRHLFGANTPPRRKSLSLITTLLWNCLCCKTTQL